MAKGFKSGASRAVVSKAAEAAAKAEAERIETERLAAEAAALEEQEDESDDESDDNRPVYSPEAFIEFECGEYRVRFPEETKPLTDKAIFDVFADQDDDLDDDDWRKAFLAAAIVPDGDALSAHAMRLGAKESKYMADTFQLLAKARDDWRGGPIMALLSLRSTYTDEELDEFAVPGSKGGNNPDKFSITVETAKGKSAQRQTTFYKQFALGTGSGKAIVERLNWVLRALNKEATKEGIPEDIVALDRDRLEAQVSFLETRLNTMAIAYRNGMKLHFKLREVNEYSEYITADILWQDKCSPDDVATFNEEGEVIASNLWNCKVEPTNEPIVLWEMIPSKAPRRDSFSISAFLKLNAKKAEEKGGGWKNLVESGIVPKPPGGGVNGAAGTQAKPDLTIKTVDTGLGVLTEFHRYMLEILGEKDKANIAKMVQETNKKGNDEYVVSFVELKNVLIDYCRDNGLDSKYLKLKQSGSALLKEEKDLVKHGSK